MIRLRFRKAVAVAAALACAALPSPLLHGALAATVSVLFEAAPLVLALGLVRGRFLRAAAALAGCGCGPAAGPAALSLPATALCWIAFGPAAALARFAAAVLLAAGRSQRAGAEAEADALETLAAIAAPAFLLALGTEFVRDGRPAGVVSALPPEVLVPLELAAGLGAGALAPCCVAAVALAAMLRVSAPVAAAGILITAGLVPAARPRAPAPGLPLAYDARLGLALLGCACAALAALHGRGFVHPRLVPLLWSALPAALFAIRRRPATRARFGAFFPAAMLAALALGSPAPPATLPASPLDGVYPGETIAFSGVATFARERTTLVRYAITCCRADASAIALPTDLRLRVPRDTWLAIRGTIERDGDGLFVHAAEWRRIAPPADPYLYR